MVLQVAEFPPQLPPAFNGIPLNGGRTHAVSVSPVDRRTAIISTQFGGLWKTTDGGDHWVHLSALPTVFSADVQHGPNGRTVVAALFWDNKVDNGGGIWVSRNGGSTWSRPPSGAVPTDARTPDRTAAWGIAKAPDDDFTWYVGTDYGIATSRDDGATWTHSRIEPTTAVIADKMQDSVRSLLAFPNGNVLAMVRDGIHRSDDRGATWRKIRAGYFGFWEGAGWNKLDRSPYWPYAFVLQDYSTLLFYELSADRWTALALPTGGGSRSPFVRTAKAYISGDYTTIWVGQGLRTIYATRKRVGSIKALQPDDWSIVGRAEGLHDDTGDLGVDGSWKPTMLGCDGGVFKPDTVNVLGDITKWKSAATPGSRLNSYQITDLGGTNVFSDGRTATTLYFATQDNAIWASTDGGNTWPNSDCAEGFHVEVQKTAAPNDAVTVAYGKVGCGPSASMFSDPGLVNQRAVPDVDASGAALANMGQAFYLKPRYWIRFRSPMGIPPPPGEIWISSDNGASWRRRFTTTLGPAGPFQRTKAHYPASYMKAYLAVGTGETNSDGSGRIGLLRLYSLLRDRVDNIGEDDIIELPNAGSLGIRATEFDWQAVFGVHPKEWRLVIAPDIVNGDIKITRDGGATWTTNAQLTNLVTKSGSLHMYKGPYFMQVTHIGFDPYNDQRIMVGTRDAGIVVSDDDGATWTTIPGSERVLYCTGFFFRSDGSVIVSTYGRGLWRITQRICCLSPGTFAYRTVSAAAGFLRLPFGVRSAPTQWIEETVREHDVKPDDEELREPRGRDLPHRPRVVVRTNLAVMGTAVLDSDGRLEVWGKGFDPAFDPPILLLDGKAVTPENWRVEPNGTVSASLIVPADLSNGEHRLEVRQGDGSRARASSTLFVKAQIDDHLDEPSESRFVVQPLDPDDDSDDIEGHSNNRRE